MSPLPTIAFCGYGRAGKDTAGEFLGRVTPLRYIGSLSWVGKSIVAKALGICEMTAWETRHQRRMEWYTILNEYRKDDPTRLIRDSLALGEIVVGVRDKAELLAAKRQGLLTHTVWIDKPGVEIDPTTTYKPEDCDCVISNHTAIEEFHGRLLDWCRKFQIPLLPS